MSCNEKLASECVSERVVKVREIQLKQRDMAEIEVEICMKGKVKHERVILETEIKKNLHRGE